MGVGHSLGRYLWRRGDRAGAGARAGLPTSGAAAGGATGGDPATVVAFDGAVEGSGDRESEERLETMDEERLRILKMVEEHKITAEEASKLLAALEVGSKPTSEPPAGRAPKWLRVRVTDVATGRAKVNVNVPIGVVMAAGKLGVRFGLGEMAEKGGIDLEELFQAIRAGAEGKLVDVTDNEDREHVEVYLE